MIVDYEWIAGVVFGADTHRINVVEDGEVLEWEDGGDNVITIYLGIVALHLIF